VNDSPSRTCRNCRHWIRNRVSDAWTTTDYGYCRLMAGPWEHRLIRPDGEGVGIEVHRDFGCHAFDQDGPLSYDLETP